MNNEPDYTDPDYPYNADVTQLPLYQSAPKQIHICVSDEGILGHLEPWNASINENAHWCEDAATSTTVKYIRADLAGQYRKALAELIRYAEQNLELDRYGDELPAVYKMLHDDDFIEFMANGDKPTPAPQAEAEEGE